MRKNTKFSMSFAELAQRGDRMFALVTRDQEHFTALGYAEDLPAQLQNKTNAFKALLPDMFYEGQQMLKTDEKSGHRQELKALLGEVRFRARLALGENSTKYRLFRFTSLTRLNDKELVSYAKHVIQTAQQMLPELAPRRVDQPMLDEIVAANTRLDDAIDSQAEAIAVREQKRVERVDESNSLYELIVELCNVGKRVWENKNEAFYDDYVLYSSSKSTEGAGSEEEVPEESEAGNL